MSSDLQIPQMYSFKTSSQQSQDTQEDVANITQEDETQIQDDSNLTHDADDPIVDSNVAKDDNNTSEKVLDTENDLSGVQVTDDTAQVVGETEDGENLGTTVLPLSKVKKIFRTDPDHVSASESAVFATAIATELFVQYFTEQASLIARSDKRKKLQYKDFSSAVSNIDQLQFLGDIVPKTVSLKKLVDQNRVNYYKNGTTPLAKGQQSLNFGADSSNANGEVSLEEGEDELPESDVEEVVEEDEDDSIEIEEDNNTEDENETDITPNVTYGRGLDIDKDIIMN